MHESEAIKLAIVDDDQSMLNLVERFLTTEFGEQLVVRKFTEPQTAFQVCCQETFDIILTDLDMPDWNGFKLLRELKKRSFLTQVIIFSAQPTTNTIASAFTLGADEYLMKPIVRNELIASVKYLSDRIRRLRVYKQSESETALVKEAVKSH